MKIKLLIVLAITTSSAFGAERLFKANANELLVEGSYMVRQSKVDYKSEYESYDLDEEGSANGIFLTGEYGVSENLALGTSLDSQQGNSYRGMGDYQFYAKWQQASIYTQASYFYSHEKSEDENATSGGNHFSLVVGYFINKNFGISLNYTPEYDYEVKDDEDTDYVSGAVLGIEGFFEFEKNKNLFGVATGLTDSRSNTEDGDTNGNDSKFMHVEGYSNIKYMSLELIPSVRYFSFIDIDSDASFDSYNFLDLTMKVRYRF